MLGWKLMTHASRLVETHRCSVRGPLPGRLCETIRRHVADVSLQDSILETLAAMLERTREVPNPPFEVDLLVQLGETSLELGIRYGAVRETLVYTL